MKDVKDQELMTYNDKITQYINAKWDVTSWHKLDVNYRE